MALRKKRQRAIALATLAAGAIWAAPAGAQFAHGPLVPEPRLERVQFREFFPFFGGRGQYYQPSPFNPFFEQRPQQTYEPTKPPPPRKVETPPTSTVLVIGDSLADWLGYGLEEAFADTPDVGIVRKTRPNSGLIRYEPRADSPEWSQVVKDLLATEKPAAIVVMLGINDRLPLRERGAAPAKTAATAPAGQAPAKATTPSAAPPADAAASDKEQPAASPAEAQHRGQAASAPGESYEFHSDKWAELYTKRIDDMIAALKSKNVPVIWVGLPAVRGTKSTSDMSYLDELYRARADKAGITYVDVWDGFVDDQGRYAVQGPDFEGQIRRLRTYDGVNFTKAGAEKLAHYVEHELRRALSSHLVPVALPGPEEQAPAKGDAVGAHPAVGPVIPLSAADGGEGGDLLGAGSHPAQHEPDALATRVLSRGDAVVAPPGRADNFSWPKPDAKTDGATDAAPVPAASPSPPAKGAAGKNNATKVEPNKNETNKTGAKKSSEAKSPAGPLSPAADNAR
jgi:uncharacterized protein